MVQRNVRRALLARKTWFLCQCLHGVFVHVEFISLVEIVQVIKVLI